MSIVLFHVTTMENAERILSDGFLSKSGKYGMDIEVEGVWLSDRPLDINEGVEGDTVLQIVIDPHLCIDHYELLEDGKPYREWCILANLINEHAKVTLHKEFDL